MIDVHVFDYFLRDVDIIRMVLIVTDVRKDIMEMLQLELQKIVNLVHVLICSHQISESLAYFIHRIIHQTQHGATSLTYNILTIFLLSSFYSFVKIL